MSALDRVNPGQRRYYRNVRNAIAVAALLHAGAFLLAPAYAPRPTPMRAEVLRVIPAEAGPIRIESGSGTRTASLPPAAHTPEASFSTLAPVVESEPASDLAPAPRQGASAPIGAASSGARAGAEEAAGPGDDGPPVYYGYDAPPRAIRRYEPAYPADARAAGAEGTVIVNVNIDETGRILRAWVVQANAPDPLIDTALEAAYHFQFEPGRARGIPVRCTVAIPFEFRLNRVLQAD